MAARLFLLSIIWIILFTNNRNMFLILGNDNSTNITSSLLNVAVVDVTSNSVKFAFQFAGPVKSIGASYFEKNNHSEEYIEWKYGKL